MNTIDRNFLINHGFKEVPLDGIKGIFQQNQVVKNLHIDITLTKPVSMLIGITTARKAVIKLEKVGKWQERLIFVQSGRAKARLFNVPLEAIKNILMKHYENEMIEIVFDIVIAEISIGFQICYQV